MEENLKDISNISFTLREIDILSCLLQKRKEKKIAEILSISPRTVEAHIYNIRTKTSLSSKEQVIDFLEVSGKSKELTKHYYKLLVEGLFLTKLQKIKSLLHHKEHYYKLINNSHHPRAVELAKKIEQDLNHAGFALSPDKQEVLTICLHESAAGLPSNLPKGTIHIFLNEPGFNTNPGSANNIHNYINFTSPANYKLNILSLIDKLLNQESITKIVTEFKRESNFLMENVTENGGQSVKTAKSLTIKDILSFKVCCILVLIIFVVFALSAFIYTKLSNNIGTNVVTSHNEPLLKEDFVLERPLLMKEMDNALSKRGEINVLAIIGMNGSGKTTLANHYAQSQNSTLIWTVNAENANSALISLECLAYAVCENEADRQAFFQLRQIDSLLQRENMLFSFLKDKAKKYKDWILIYDNVKNFNDIRKYVPQCLKSWGPGKVIITTTNSNIINNSYIKNYTALYIPTLTPDEKVRLFSQITNINEPDSKLETFLTKIPPFPLDVSQAACYIKNTNIGYDEYLKQIKEGSQSFADSQQYILNDYSTYTKTRKSIVELSVDYIIKANKEFAGLLLLSSILDAENIPIDLFVAYKGALATTSFLNEMRKFSLLKENKGNNESNKNYQSTFDIHSSVQSIILHYIHPLIPQGQYNEIILCIERMLEDELLIQKYPSQLQHKIKHLESLLSYNSLFSKESVFIIQNILGNYYRKIQGDLKKAMEVLKHARSENIKDNSISRTNLAKNSMYLGNIYRDLNQFAKAEQFSGESIELFNQQFGKTNKFTAWALVTLGNTYTLWGKFKEAETTLLQALEIYKQLHELPHTKIISVLNYLAKNYIESGDYSKAENLLLEAIDNLSKMQGTSDMKLAWSKLYLGNLYLHLGKYKEARQYIEESLPLFTNTSEYRHEGLSWALAHLGEIYADLGETAKAQDYLDQALKLFRNTRIDNGMNIGIADVYLSLGKMHMKAGNKDKAVEYLKEVNTFYKSKYHDTYYKRALVKLYLSKIEGGKSNLPKEKSSPEYSLLLEKHYGKIHPKLSGY
ncbi:MAG: hypothetical protein Tsb006_1630 [Rickettsiaceae bacterium]